MGLAGILTLIGFYMVIGLILSFHYANDNFEDDMGSELFYKLFGGWCEKNNASYPITMILFSMACWPVYIITMAHSIVYGVWLVVSMLAMEIYKISKGIKATVLKQ